MFSLYEIASFLGRPVCLYEFSWGPTKYRYTSADRDITYGTEVVDELTVPIVWTALPISDNGFTQGISSQDFVVTVPSTIPVVGLFRTTPPSTSIDLVCRRFHRDDPAQEAVVYWTGTVGNVKRPDNVAKAEIIGLPITSTIRKTGLRLCWELNCNHALYDEGCKADKTLFNTPAVITELTPTTITVDTLGAFPPERYAGGFLEWEATAEGTIDRRAIEAWVEGTTLAMLGSTDRLLVGQAITLYLGCDLTAATCQGVFNNLANHSGYHFMPRKSPFDGDPIF